MDAVGREKLVVLIPVPNILLVALVVADRIGLLDRAAGRRVVTRRGQPQGRSVAVWNLTLDESLAERTATNNRTTVVILQCPGEDFARRRASLVDQHHNVHVLCGARAVGVFAELFMLAVFRVDDQLVFVQEFVGDHDGLVEIAARVAPQVEDEFGGALRTQRIQRCLHLVEGRPCELSQLDVTDAVGNAER